MSTPKIYGIKNCDTVKKAKRWLETNGIDYEFTDMRIDGIDTSDIEKWLSKLASDVLVNKRSTTWKGLSDAEKAAVLGGETAKILLENPTLIKRPLLALDDNYYVGFSEKNYQALFGK